MQKTYTPVSADKAVKSVKSGDRIHLHSVACTPTILLEALMKRADELSDVTIQHIHTEGPAPYAEENGKYMGTFELESFFVGGNVRKATQAGYADYIPVFLSETQRLIREEVLPIDVAMVQISPPDQHGWVSIGTSVDCSKAAIEKANTVIAVVNKHIPRAWGDAMMPLSDFDIFVEHDSPLIEAHMPQLSNQDIAIGENVANLIEDGATLQMGIGAIPNAVLSQLGNHKNLGVHTEMFSDGLLPLIEKGIVNGANKVLDRGKIVASFLMGSKDLYNFVDDNPGVLMQDVHYTNSVHIIKQNPKVTAINSAIQIDITGQVCADSIGTKFYSGVGGQIDFMRGASFSEGGKPILAIPSVTKKGMSKIAPMLCEGGGVVTTRANMHWLVTEFGAVNLYGKTLQKRARDIISIAHPDHQEALEKAAFERFGSHYHFIKSQKEMQTRRN